MKKFLFILLGLSVFGVAFAAGENVPTSKSYVDSKIAEKQNIIPANDGATRVLTNTGTAGDYNTKGIYDATGEYAPQAQNLVDAATMNAGVQNAIDSEFQCIEYDENNECLLMDVFGTPPQQILPTGYTALEYIENSGRQYIDTLISGNNNNLRIITKFNVLSTAGSAYQGYYYSGIFGNYASETADVYRLYTRSNQRNCSISNNNCDQHFRANLNTRANTATIIVTGADNNIELGTDYVIDMSQSRVTINGEFVPFYSDIVHGTANNGTIKLFAGAVGGDTGGGVYAKTRIYYFSMYNGTTLVRNFIPARRDSDGVLGMYDTVTNTFFTNSGTGNFIGGPVVNLYIPAGQ